jgi:hypothetical protein
VAPVRFIARRAARPGQRRARPGAALQIDEGRRRIRFYGRPLELSRWSRRRT